jgi:hypothetical protein
MTSIEAQSARSTDRICRDQLATESHGQIEATPIQPIRQAPRDATRAASEAPG